MTGLDGAVALARNVVTVKYEDISPDVLEVTKKDILDVLAAAIGGSTAPGCKEVVALIKEWGGKQESSILLHGRKVPALHAAQVNAMMGHALEYDDAYCVHNGTHIGVVIIPTCFAMAERQGNVTGKEFLTAVTLGLDVGCRMDAATKPQTDLSCDGWFPTSLYGGFSAAAAAGKILRLDEEKMTNAFGIAYEQASGTMQCVFDGALTKRMCPGFAARAGILSALMAERGITGARNCLQGKAGLYTIYYSGNCDLNALIGGLGERFEGVNLSFKPYPCCRGKHPAIDATMALVKEHGLKPEDVAEVTIFEGRMIDSEQMETNRKPRTVVDAQFSIPWVVAAAIVRGEVGLREFTAEAIKDRWILEMAQKVTVKIDESLNISVSSAILPTVVEIRTRDGRLLLKRMDSAYGSPENPMSFEAVAEKLKDCASYAVKQVPRENLGKVVTMVQQMEELDDVSSIMQQLR